MKSIELTPLQIKGTAFISPIEGYKHGCLLNDIEYETNIDWKHIISMYSPLQKDDSVWIKEDFDKDIVVGMQNGYPIEKTITLPASQMQQHQSRYTFDVDDIEIKRVKDINLHKWFTIMGANCMSFGDSYQIYFNNLMQELNQPITYNENPYIILVNHSGLKDTI